MATGELSALDSWGPSQLKIILLGGRNSGKSHVGNLLLGKEEFVTRERTLCSRRLGVVAGRWLTVVDTPGWWCDFSANDTSELVKREMVSSISLCSPGPHVFLITIKVSSAFSEIRRRAVEEHVALLGERVWSYCMVVLISTDKHTTELVGSGGKALQWLIEKCKQRCHSIIRNDDSEVTELLQKIQKLVTENGNAVFESQGDILQKTAEEKRRVEERARQRFMRMREHRSLMRERLRPVTDIRIVLLGAKGSGKTSVLKTILSSRESSTPHSRTAQCLVGHGAVFGRQVTVVDTPGWWMNYFRDETTAFDRREMVLGLSLCPPGPHVFLLVIRVDKAFPDTYRRAAQEHLQLFGEHVWSRVIVLFTFGDWLGETTTEQHIESEGEPLQWLVEICGNRYHVLNNKTKGDGFQVRELIGKIEETLAAGCNSGDGGGLYYEMERQVMQQLVEERRGERERAEERRRRKKERQMARTPLEKPLPDLRIVLVGGGKTGKSSCGNTILGTDEIFTTATTQTTTSCSEQGARISGRTVTVLDTPGCFSVTSDLIVMSSCALLLVVNASSSFKASQMVAIEEQLKAGKRQIWGKAVVLFSHGDCLGDTSIEQRIESEGKTLQRLVEKCGNRYHVLDNKKRGDGSQVNELLGLIEETLDEGRLAALHGGDRVWKSVSSAPEQQQMGAVARCNKGLTSRGLQLASAVTEPAHPTTQTVTSLQHLPDNGLPQIVEAAGQTTRPTTTILERGSLLSCLASMLSGKEQLSWTVTLPPAWFPTEDLQPPRRPNGESQMQLFFSPRQRPTMFVEEHVNGVSSLCHPVLRERTLQRLSRSSGGLQALLDQWGEHSGSVEELEAFIDSYFEMVWEQTMGSFQPDQPEPPTELQWAGKVEEEEEVLTSIDRRLSKLELLEEIKSDLSELRKSLEQSWKAIEELKEKSKQDQNKTW